MLLIMSLLSMLTRIRAVDVHVTLLLHDLHIGIMKPAACSNRLQ